MCWHHQIRKSTTEPERWLVVRVKGPFDGQGVSYGFRSTHSWEEPRPSASAGVGAIQCEQFRQWLWFRATILFVRLHIPRSGWWCPNSGSLEHGWSAPRLRRWRRLQPCRCMAREILPSIPTLDTPAGYFPEIEPLRTRDAAVKWRTVPRRNVSRSQSSSACFNHVPTALHMLHDPCTGCGHPVCPRILECRLQ